MLCSSSLIEDAFDNSPSLRGPVHQRTVTLVSIDHQESLDIVLLVLDG
jgi:hypothetical protein